MENEEYSYSREAIKRAIDTFANRISIDKETVLTDEDVENIIKAPDIQECINGDHIILDFEDGLAIGISVGYRIGIAHMIDIAFGQAVVEVDE